MPSRRWARASPAKSLGEHRPELQYPSPHRFVGDIQPSLCEQIFDVAIAERKTEIEPSGVPDDRRRKLMARKRDRHALSYSSNGTAPCCRDSSLQLLGRATLPPPALSPDHAGDGRSAVRGVLARYMPRRLQIGRDLPQCAAAAVDGIARQLLGQRDRSRLRLGELCRPPHLPVAAFLRSRALRNLSARACDPNAVIQTRDAARLRPGSFASAIKQPYLVDSMDKLRGD
jgi:hypothetical protein